MPGSLNLPYTEVVGPDGVLLPRPALLEAFGQAGVDFSRPVITACGSGVTACALLLGLEVLGHRDHTVYDGSWSEWGARGDTPVEIGSGSASPPHVIPGP